MFSIGFGEIVVILLVAVLFLNPKDLPKIAHSIGRWYSKFKEMYNSLDNIKEKTIDIIEKEITSDRDKKINNIDNKGKIDTDNF